MRNFCPFSNHKKQDFFQRVIIHRSFGKGFMSSTQILHHIKMYNCQLPANCTTALHKYYQLDCGFCWNYIHVDFIHSYSPVICNLYMFKRKGIDSNWSLPKSFAWFYFICMIMHCTNFYSQEFPLTEINESKNIFLLSKYDYKNFVNFFNISFLFFTFNNG